MTKNKTVDKKPDFATAYSKANEILAKSRVVNTFPFSPIELVKELSDIKCRTYKSALKRQIDITALGSNSAIIIRNDNKQIIFYDDTKPITHIKYSILHEFGHVLNNHDFSVKDKKIYTRYEIESNYFVAQLLMPEQIANIGVSRSVGHYLQQQGKYVIPNARWGENEHIQRAFLITYLHFRAYRKTVLYQSALTGAVKAKRISITSKQGLKQC